MGNIVVYITASKEEEAEKIARTLVEEKLAGCVNIIKNIRSIYSWEGKIEDDPEILMIAKTQQYLFEELSKKVKELEINSIADN